MNQATYHIRNYQPADEDSYALFNTETSRLDPSGSWLSIEVITERKYRLNYTPERDLFIAETGGNIAGYLDITPEMNIKRVILNCLVHPDHRRQGLGTRLLHRARRRARELGAKLAHVNIREDNEIAQKVLPRLDFKLVRRFLQLRLDLAKVRWLETAPPCHCLRPEKEAELAQLQNRAFASNWGYSPNTTSEIAHRARLGKCSPDDVLLADSGDKVIGYCWTRTGGKATAGKGQIYMLGVDPDYRGRGIGRSVLLAGLAHLRDKGEQCVELTVDSENKAARALYRSVGFEITSRSLWYEKAVD